MQDTTISAAICLPNEALLFDLDELYTCLQTVADQRSRQGLRYPLASLLMIGVLGKLAGQDSSRALAHWAKLRAQELSQLFHLKRESMPHYSTWSRVLGHGVEPSEMEKIVGRFFASATQPSEGKRGSLQLALDGKTLRGTIPLGKTRGVHLLAVYLPTQGVVLAQMQVDEKSNEITHAPKLLASLDLRGVVVSGEVYHPHVKAKPFGCSASLRSLDMGWCVEPGPHREGTRSRRCGRRLTGTHRKGSRSPGKGRGDRFGDSS